MDGFIPLPAHEDTMAKTNFQYEKRQRELEKKRKTEEKERRKKEAKLHKDEPGGEGAPAEDAEQDTETQPESGTV